MLPKSVSPRKTKARFIELFGDPVSNSYGLPEATLSDLGEFGRGVSNTAQEMILSC